MIKPFDTSFAFRPDVRVIVYNADNVELRSGVWSCNSITFSDDDRKGILGTIVLGLLEKRSIAEISQQGQISQEEIVSVIEALAANDLLITKDQLESWSRTNFLVAPTLGTMKEVRTIPRRAVILGSPALTAFLQTTLPPQYVSALSVADQAQVEMLVHSDLFLGRDGLTNSMATEPFAEWQDALVVALWPELNPIFLGNLNRLAHSIGFPFFSATVDGPFVMLGPAVLPHLTPCFACAEARVLETLRDHTLYIDYRAALASQKIHGALPEAMDPLQATCLSLAAWEIVNLLTVGSAFTVGKVLTLYAPTMEFAFHELTRFPGCPVCSARAALDPQLYSDLRSYLSSSDQLGEREVR